MIKILGQPKIAGWLTVTRQLQCADVACLTFPSPLFSSLNRKLGFDGIRTERDLNETSSESDTYSSSCVPLSDSSPNVHMSILGDTKLIQIPENPLLSSFRTKTNTLVKDEKTAGTRDIFLEGRM